MSYVKRIVRNKSFGLLLILAGAMILFSLLNGNYLKLSNIKTILINASTGGTLMIGFATLLISGNADLSVAAVGTIASITCCKLITSGAPWPLAVVVGLALGGLCGAVNAVMWFRFRIMPFIGTMGISSVWTGLAAYITKNAPVLVENQGFFKLGSLTFFGFLPISFAYVAVLALLYGLLLSRTKFGRKVYMCGGNVFAARLSGVNVTKVGAIMMINCSTVSAFGGIVLAARMHQITSDSLAMTLMSSMTGAFLGGVSFGGGSGGMLGAFLGLLVLNFFNNGLIMAGMGTYWQIFAQGVLLIVALTVDHFGTKARMNALKPRV
ncbi:MAG: ABC transporter permease [Oscillospiraceae bacterium]|jgi:ribose/xylose/arabinose/galactoside ABC-type transport system permease subunit|nr:ABC transporter permease [Oscillospiraceae bacterium]